MFYFLYVFISCIAIYLMIKGLKDKKKKELISNLLKKASVAFLAIAFINVFLPDKFSLRYNWNFPYLSIHHDSFHAIVRLIDASAIVTLPIVMFFDNKYIKKYVTYILSIGFILSFFSYNTFIEYYTSEYIKEYATVFGDKLYPFLTNVFFRSFIFGILLFISMMIIIYNTIINYKDLKFESKKEVTNFIFISIGLLLTNMPIYTIQQLFGTTSNITFNFLDPMHFVFIFIIILEFIVLYKIFKDKTYETKYILLLIMALSLLFQYNTFFKTDGVITATRYPLQLCNIAGAFMLITLLTKNEKMFHFTLTINVTGAMIAIILCDSTKDVGVLYEMNIHYMVEHINVFLIPLLAISLGVFKPLKKKDSKDMLIGFACYYMGVLLIGTILNSLYKATENDYFKCNYLFMFDKEAGMRLVGDFVGTLFDIKLTLFKFIEFSMVQLIIFIVFSIICTGIFFLLYTIFKGKDNLLINE